MAVRKAKRKAKKRVAKKAPTKAKVNRGNPNGNPKRFRTPTWRKEFLEVLGRERSVQHAAAAAGISKQTAYNHRQADKEFEQAWDAALVNAVGLLEHSAFSRATFGLEKPVFYQGEVCGHIREWETALTIFLLKKLKPEIYGDSVEDPKGKMSREERVRAILAMMDKATEVDSNGDGTNNPA